VVGLAASVLLQLDVRWSLLEALHRYEELIHPTTNSGVGTGHIVAPRVQVQHIEAGMQRVVHELIVACLDNSIQLNPSSATGTTAAVTDSAWCSN
jgi:hypothetical protein